jgi:hypothetical protein
VAFPSEYLANEIPENEEFKMHTNIHQNTISNKTVFNLTISNQINCRTSQSVTAA